MIFDKCGNCGANLRVEENDTIPGCREMEEYTCPVCGEVVGKVFTSGIPVAYEIKQEDTKNE